MDLRLLVATLAGATLAGCALTPLGTARTLDPGATLHQAGLGMATLDGWLVPAMSYEYRRGLGEGVEAGAGLRGPGPVLDLKLALVRGDAVALAIDPGVAVLPNLDGVFGSLPVMCDLDLASWSTLVVSAMPAIDSMLDQGYLGGGVGLVLRVSDGFAVQPAVQWLAPVGGDFDPLDGGGSAYAGLGFLFAPGANRVPAR